MLKEKQTNGGNEVKNEEIIRAIAELAGIIKPNGELIEDYCWYKGFIWTTDGAGIPDEIWDVTRSRDAIVPILQKKPMEIKELVAKGLGCKNDYCAWIDATPARIAEELLRAHGLWIDK